MDLTSGGVSATPTIDKYMSEGVILAAVYGGTSCTPGRGSFLSGAPILLHISEEFLDTVEFLPQSGRYPMRYGIQSGGVGQDSKKGIFVNNSLISNDMQKAGYATLFLGKVRFGAPTVSLAFVVTSKANSVVNTVALRLCRGRADARPPRIRLVLRVYVHGRLRQPVQDAE